MRIKIAAMAAMALACSMLLAGAGDGANGQDESRMDSDSRAVEPGHVVVSAKPRWDTRGENSSVSLTLSFRNSGSNSVYVLPDDFKRLDVSILDDNEKLVGVSRNHGHEYVPLAYFYGRGRGVRGKMFVVPVLEIKPGEVQNVLIPDVLRGVEHSVATRAHYLRLGRFPVYRHPGRLIERENTQYRLWVPGKDVPGMSKQVYELASIELLPRS